MEDIWYFDERILKSSLSGYPRLSSALFPRSANQNLKESSDISLYELLQVICFAEKIFNIIPAHCKELVGKVELRSWVGLAPLFCKYRVLRDKSLQRIELSQ